MGAHIMRAKDQKKSLSFQNKTAAQKTRNVKVRNVLAWPKSCTHWPLLDEQSDDDLKNLLGSLLVPARLPKNSLPLAAVLKLKGNDRKEARKQLCAKETDTCKILRSKMLLGMNCVTRSLEKGEACCVILAGDIRPATLGKHIINICFLKEVPVIVMPSLKKTTEQHLGVACITLGFKKFENGMKDDHFSPLIERIMALSANLTRYQEPISEDYENDASIPSLEIPLKKENTSENVQNIKVEGDIYKYRSSKKERAFVPGGIEEKKKTVCIPSKQSVKAEAKLKIKPDFSEQDFVSFGDDSGGPAVLRKPNIKAEQKSQIKPDFSQQDFLSFDDTSSASHLIPKRAMVEAKEPAEKTEKSVPQRKLPQYQPLIVKSIQSNPNKTKKKKVKESKTTGKAPS